VGKNSLFFGLSSMPSARRSAGALSFLRRNSTTDVSQGDTIAITSKVLRYNTLAHFSLVRNDNGILES
jgi:hypothetical protein